MDRTYLVRARIATGEEADVEITQEDFDLLSKPLGISMSSRIESEDRQVITLDWLRERMDYANSRKEQLRKIIMEPEDKAEDRALWNGYIEAIREVARHLGVEKDLFVAAKKTKI